MSTTKAKQAYVQKNGAATFIARVVGWTNAPITPSDVATVAYTVYLLDEQDPNAETAVAGHTAVAISPVSDVLHASLQTGDARWNDGEMGGGYNFLHTIDVRTTLAFALRGRRYLVRYTLTPTSTDVQLVHVEFLLFVR